MRLIDADAFREQAYTLNFRKKLSDGGLFFINIAIDEQPTVDAVPVAFIEKRMDKLNKLIEYEINEMGDFNGLAMHGLVELKTLIEDWRAENES